MTAKAAVPFLIGMMLLTGCCNTLFTKYQDMQCVRNCSAPNPKDRRNFEQPVWQTAQMFVGEMGCWLIVAASALYTNLSSSGTHVGYEPIDAQTARVDSAAEESSNPGERTDGFVHPAAKPLEPHHPERQHLMGWRVIVLALPSTCDIAGTTLMNVGLLFVAASIYQMTRGALVLFVGLFSILFLRHRLSGVKWLALVVVVAGVGVVSLAGALEQRGDRKLPGDTNDGNGVLNAALQRSDLLRALASRMIAGPPTPVAQTLLGILLIFLAQIFTAAQFVLEESIMHRYSLGPLTMVGWEGTFGLIVTLLAQLVLHLVYGRTEGGRGGYFDATTGWQEMTRNKAIGVSSVLIMISIGFFNYFGLCVTRTISATSRSTIDTCRTLFIWVVSLGLGWETFKWLQVVGFAMLVYGTFLFNEIIQPPAVRWMGGRARDRPEGDGRLQEDPIEHM